MGAGAGAGSEPLLLDPVGDVVAGLVAGLGEVADLVAIQAGGAEGGEGVGEHLGLEFLGVAAGRHGRGSPEDIVTMTVFIRNQADGDEFVKIRGEVFKSGFPGSALITAKDFAVPQLLVEIQSIAVIGERN